MPVIYVKIPNRLYTYQLPEQPGAEVLVGAAPYCQLSLPGVPGLAPVHARIVRTNAEYMIADAGSTQGIYANGTQVRSVFLMPGIEYVMGAASIILSNGRDLPPGGPPAWGAAASPAYPPAPAGPAWGSPQAQPAPPVSPPAEPTAQAPKRKFKKASREDMSLIRERFSNLSHARTSRKKKYIIWGLLALLVAFFANLLPIKREDAKEFLNRIVRDMGKSSSSAKR